MKRRTDLRGELGRRSCIRALAVAVGSFAFFVMSAPVARAIVASDGTFNPSDWDVTIFYAPGNGGRIDVADQVPTGGNPGAYREIGLTVYGTDYQHPYSGIWTFHRYIPFVYNPSVDGAIALIDYDEDWIHLSGPGDGEATGPALRQGGVVYFDGPFATPDFEWTHLGLTGLRATDFIRADLSGAHPDFSSSGGPIEIGFYRANSASDGGYSEDCGIDNWTLNIHPEGPVPVQTTSWGRIKALF